MEIKLKGKTLSPAALVRLKVALGAIVRANPSQNWDNFKAYVTVRKQTGPWPWQKIFPARRVYLDLVDKSLKPEITIPEEVFGKAYEKKGLGGRPIWSIRFSDMKAVKWPWQEKVSIKMKGE